MAVHKTRVQKSFCLGLSLALKTFPSKSSPRELCRDSLLSIGAKGTSSRPAAPLPLTNSFMHSISVLNIECLQNYWGYILDMPLTVGEVFDDLPANTTDISRSIVKVVRSPPTPEELENPLRFVSLAAESSARPRKRPLTQLAAAVWDSQYPGENAQGWGSDGLIDGNGSASKRRKLQNSVSHTGFGFDRPTFRSEGLQDGVYISSRTSARRLSPNRRVVDSPRSSRKRM